MLKFLSSSLLLALAASPSAHAAELTEPFIIRSDLPVWDLEITVEPYRFTSDPMSFTTRAYCYQGKCSVPGPTLSVKPGDKIQLRMVNKLLPDDPHTHEIIMNSVHNPNTTNIHTHGIHISANADHIFTAATGGQTVVYNYEIPADHAPGWHWYHTHVHGAATFQLLGGLLAGLIVEPKPASQAAIILSKIKHHQMIFHQFKFSQETHDNGVISQGCNEGFSCTPFQGCATNAAAAAFYPFRMYSYLELSNEIGNKLNPNLVLAPGQELKKADYYYVNGQYRPTLSVFAGESRVLRMNNAVGGLPLVLHLNAGCTYSSIAMDGVYTYKTQARQTKLIITAAVRVDLQFVCPTAGTYIIQGEWGFEEDAKTETLFTIQVTAPTTPLTDNQKYLVTDNDLALITAQFPSYLNDLRQTNATKFAEFYLHQEGRPLEWCNFWMGIGPDCSKHENLATDKCRMEQFKGSKGGTGYGVGTVPSTYKAWSKTGEINEWTYYGHGIPIHPMHLHVHHVQIINFEIDVTDPTAVDTLPYYLQIGEWRDTLPIMGGKTVVRFRAADFAGETIVHCHFLRHEDLGMMDSVYFCDEASGACGTPPTNTTVVKLPYTSPVVIQNGDPIPTPASQATTAPTGTLVPTTSAPTTAMVTITPTTTLSPNDMLNSLVVQMSSMSRMLRKQLNNNIFMSNTLVLAALGAENSLATLEFPYAYPAGVANPKTERLNTQFEFDMTLLTLWDTPATTATPLALAKPTGPITVSYFKKMGIVLSSVDKRNADLILQQVFTWYGITAPPLFVKANINYQPRYDLVKKLLTSSF